MQKQNHRIGATFAMNGDPLFDAANRNESVFTHGLCRCSARRLHRGLHSYCRRRLAASWGCESSSKGRNGDLNYIFHIQPSVVP
jgi:hypothetical protein